MLVSKILHARLQPDVQAGFRKGTGTRGQIANIHWIIQKVRKFQKNIYLFHWLRESLWLWRSWQTMESWEMGIPDHPTCLLRNPYVGQEATVRTLYGTTDWLKIEKRVRLGCLLSPVCLTYTLSTSWDMPGWVSYKAESTQAGKTSTSDMQMIAL